MGEYTKICVILIGLLILVFAIYINVLFFVSIKYDIKTQIRMIFLSSNQKIKKSNRKNRLERIKRILSIIDSYIR